MIKPLHRRLLPRLEIEDRRIEGFGRARRIEIFGHEQDLHADRAKEHYVFLAVGAPCMFDKSLCPDLGDCRLWISKGIHLEIEKAKVFHCTEEPGDVTDHFRSA